jgi:hypothetical protein
MEMVDLTLLKLIYFYIIIQKLKKNFLSFIKRMQRETNYLEKEMKKTIKIYNSKLSKIKMVQWMETKIINRPQYNGGIKTNW